MINVVTEESASVIQRGSNYVGRDETGSGPENAIGQADIPARFVILPKSWTLGDHSLRLLLMYRG